MELSSSDFDGFLKVVLPSMGLNWRRYRRKNIRRRILHRLDALGLASVSQYIEILTADGQEFQLFYSLLTVTISRFFRNRTAYERLWKEVIPDIVKRDGRLNIWSIGCAGGEEPYSLVILWDAYLKDRYPNITPVIIATDIDRDCLKRAEAAIYEKSSLRELPKELVDRYFMHERCHFTLREEIKKAVEFRFHDIQRDAPLKGNNLILCRNLAFTYFGEELQKKALETIHEGLIDKGYLIIGRQEVLQKNALFESIYPKDGIYGKLD